MDQPAISESQLGALSVRMMMQGKEVGSIIGKKGDNVRRYRDESGAKINISDGSCPERIVTISGTVDQVRYAFNMICHKFEEDLQCQASAGLAMPSPLPPISMKLVVPASQCGSLIGKGGAKIKEIREVTGASIQVASEMLLSSTERTVTVSGSPDAVIKCIHQICIVLMESPPKGVNIPYRPKSRLVPGPVLYATTANGGSSQPFTVSATHFPGSATRIGASEMAKMPAVALSQLPSLTSHASFMLPQGTFMSGLGIASMNGLNRMNGGGGYLTRQLSGPPTAGSASVGAPPAASQQLTIPNELIGCIIGRGGAKINEIRQLSGAQIKISNCEEGSSDRKVTITGLPETIGVATYLINTRLHTELEGVALSNSCTGFGILKLN